MQALLLCCFIIFLFQQVCAEESAVAPAIFVCESADPNFLGVYTAGRDQKMDDVAVYSNEKDMSFFRNKGFWYLGSLADWPPATHYRCVEAEGCNFGMEVPPTSEEGVWKGSKKFNDGNAPRISRDPCNTASFEEL